MNDLQPILMIFGLVLLVAFVFSSGQQSNNIQPPSVTFLLSAPTDSAGGCGQTLLSFMLLGGAAFVLLFLL